MPVTLSIYLVESAKFPDSPSVNDYPFKQLDNIWDVYYPKLSVNVLIAVWFPNNLSKVEQSI